MQLMEVVDCHYVPGAIDLNTLNNTLLWLQDLKNIYWNPLCSVYCIMWCLTLYTPHLTVYLSICPETLFYTQGPYLVWETDLVQRDPDFLRWYFRVFMNNLRQEKCLSWLARQYDCCSAVLVDILKVHFVRYTRGSLHLHPPIRRIFSFNQNK